MCECVHAPCPSKESSIVQPSIGVLSKQIILNIFYVKPIYMFGGFMLAVVKYIPWVTLARQNTAFYNEIAVSLLFNTLAYKQLDRLCL